MSRKLFRGVCFQNYSYAYLHIILAAFADCYELLMAGQTQSAVYRINPGGKQEFEVFCDQSAQGGGWVVIQKRFSGLVDFFLNWTSYKVGFGNLTGEFWLGLGKIHRLTSLKRMVLRVDLGDFHNMSVYAEYDKFRVLSEQDSYALELGKYTGILKSSRTGDQSVYEVKDSSKRSVIKPPTFRM